MKKNYFNELQYKIDKYKRKHSPFIAACKIIFFSIKSILRPNKEIETIHNLNVTSINSDVLRIAIAEGGGFGDDLIQTIYIKQIRRLFDKPVIIDFYCRSYKAFQNYPFIDNCFPYSEHHQTKKYDVYIISRRFYIVSQFDKDKTKNFSTKFFDFLIDCQNLTNHILAGEYNDNLFTQYALIHSKNRLEQSNCHNKLALTRHTTKYIQWDLSGFSILKQYGLTDKKYITVSRSCDSNYDDSHPKLWPLVYYNELIHRIKSDFPEITIIQVGANLDFPLIKGIDINLLGKTNLEQIKCLLKYALLHIDGEGGLVHLRNFLNGKSLVFFGPTSPEIFGYTENINLQSHACRHTCEWVTPNWTKGCLKTNGKSPALCMQSLTPDIAYQHLSKYLTGLGSYFYELKITQINDLQLINQKKIALIGKKGLNFIRDRNNKITVFDTDMSSPPTGIGVSLKNCNYMHDLEKNGISAEFATPYNIPVQDNSFDIVYCNRPDNLPYAEYIIREALRILKPEGTFYFGCDKKNTAIFNKFLPEILHQNFQYSFYSLTKRKLHE